MWRASNRSSLRAGVGCARLLWSSVQAATTTGRIEENTMSVSRFLRARLCLALFALAAASAAHAAPGDFLTPEFLLNPDHSGHQSSDLARDAAGRILSRQSRASGKSVSVG